MTDKNIQNLQSRGKFEINLGTFAITSFFGFVYVSTSKKQDLRCCGKILVLLICDDAFAKRRELGVGPGWYSNFLKHWQTLT